MRRRDAIKTIGGLTSLAVAPKVLGGCSADAPSEGITTIVALMMENRSYDHYFGARSMLEGWAGNGPSPTYSNPAMDATPVEIAQGTQLCVFDDPPHGWDSSRVQFNAGANDGFVRAHQASYGAAKVRDPMTYLVRDQLPALYTLADAGTVCDAWYSSIMGPTWPNRMYFHAGTSAGTRINEIPTNGFTFTSIYNRLDAAGIDWGYYFSDLPVLGIVNGLELEGRLHRVLYDFIDDAAAGRLPPVTVLDPAFGGNDDHPPHHPALGQQFISMVYNALATSPQWNNILFLITYDEHGGFFDHVPPPLVADDHAAEGFDQLGFRVPSVVLGPYAKQGYVSSTQYDHTSFLAHVEAMFDLEPLTARDAAANPLTDCIDLERLAARDPAPPIELPTIEVDEISICGLEGPADHDVLKAAPLMDAKWDKRHETRDMVYAVGDYLDKHNLGRIRRDHRSR